MSLDLLPFAPLDRTRINCNDSTELMYWAAYLQVEPTELTVAVSKVGPCVWDVLRHLEPALLGGAFVRGSTDRLPRPPAA